MNVRKTELLKELKLTFNSFAVRGSLAVLNSIKPYRSNFLRHVHKKFIKSSGKIHFPLIPYS